MMQLGLSSWNLGWISANLLRGGINRMELPLKDVKHYKACVKQ